MGGAAGHMSHLHEDLDITFGEIKSILEDVAKAKLSAIEKADGQNIFFTWNAGTGEVHTARTEEDIEDGGMLPAKYAEKWRRHPAKGAFMNGFEAIWRGINKLDRNTLVAIFGEDGNNWVNSEIMYMDNPNIINYNGDWIVLHGIKTYIPPKDSEDKGDYQINSEAFQLLVSVIEHAENEMDEQNWKISGPRVRQLNDISKEEHYGRFVQELDAIGMQNNTAIGAYVEKQFHQEYYNELSLPEDKKDLLFLRIMKLCRGIKPKKLAITNPELDMKNIYEGSREHKAELKALGLSNQKDILLKRNQYLFPIEVAISNLAIEVLRGLKSYFVDEHDKTINKIRNKLEGAQRKIENLISSGDENAEKLGDLLDKQLGKLGTYENIASSLEGVIFEYPPGSHRLYKLTGAFAMVNQIVGRAPRDEKPSSLNEHEEDMELDPPEEYNPEGNISIGLVPMSAKPFHAGHMKLVEKAAQDNDFVKVFVPLTDRVKKGEFPIYGHQMERIWKEYLMILMPSNVDVDMLEEGVQPVKLVYETLGNAGEINSQHTYQVYSDSVDTPRNYPEKYRQQYFPTLYNNGQVRFPAADNPEQFTRGKGMPDISGTKVRETLQNHKKPGAFKAFDAWMPPGIDARAIWNILLGIEEEESEITETKKKGASHATICGLIEEVIEEQTEPFQMKVKAKHPKAKKDYLTTGANKGTGGGCGHTKPSIKRGKSAPPMGEGEALEESPASRVATSVAKRLQSVGKMSTEMFLEFVDSLTQDLNSSQKEETFDIYVETALELKRSWRPRIWEIFTDEEKQVLLKMTYPNTPYNESLSMMIESLTNPTIKKIIYSDILLTVEKASEAKKGIEAGEYLGPTEPGGKPKSPHWKEFLEEISAMGAGAGGGSVEGHSSGAWIGFDEEENEEEKKRTKKKSKKKMIRRESKEDEFVEEILNYLLKTGRSKNNATS